MVHQSTAILWIRNDFRLQDNCALTKAATWERLIPVYIWDDRASSPWKPGSASKWWLHQSLKIFKQSLQKAGSDLMILQGAPQNELTSLARKYHAKTVFWNRSYNPMEARNITALMKALTHSGISGHELPGGILCEPHELLKKDLTPYQVFTPFWRNFLNNYRPVRQNQPRKLPPLPDGANKAGLGLQNLNLIPDISWYGGIAGMWSPGEKEAGKRVKNFLKEGIQSYHQTRDLPAVTGTSLLSPYLHFGEIHPQRVLWMIQEEFGEIQLSNNPGVLQFCKEILWREFSYHLLQHFPETPDKPLKEKFQKYPWRRNKKLFEAWTSGQTGYPVVDAGMRQLWKTGWMHNRVRMITASFLVKHLGIPWQEGAKWFWDTLVDADLANNTQGWQWTAGCGADAQPFFRIFNPVTQGEKFDPSGQFVATWCPELAHIPPKWIFRPWEAPAHELKKGGVVLGKTYPWPVVDHKEARRKALSNYEKLRTC